MGMAFLSSAQNTVYSIGLNPALWGYVIQLTADKKHGVVVETKDLNKGPYIYAEVSWAMRSRDHHTEEGAKFTDWRLPTKRELEALFFQKNAIGGFYDKDYEHVYFSSTSGKGVYTAWAQFFNTGEDGERPTSKDFPGYFRAVRDF